MAGGWRLEWLSQQLHPRFPGGTTRFALIAGLAGGDHVVPCVLSAHVSRKDMVQSYLTGLPATVLAGILITDENPSPRQLCLWARPFDHMSQTNNRGGYHREGRTSNHTRIVFDHFGLVLEDQYDSAPDLADIEGLEVLVENQHGGNLTSQFPLYQLILPRKEGALQQQRGVAPRLVKPLCSGKVSRFMGAE